ncbi:MAG: MCE family protein [Solirubrobacterales bacterium]|nr:MCE family protein [Solirubrobacterales bacterium]
MLRVVTLGALVVAVVFVASLIFSSDSGYKYKFDFQSASGIVNGNHVMIGGSPVGSITSVELTDDMRVEMEVEIDRELHEGTAAVIRKSSLSSLHNHYISISPGPDNAPVVPEGSSFGEGVTTTAVELDQFFDTFDETTRKGWSNWIQGIAAIYAGEGAEGANKTFKYSGTAFSSTQRLMAELADQDTHLDQFVSNTSSFVTKLAEVSPQLTELVSNSNKALGAIADNNESLALALQELPPTLRQGNTTFANLRVALDDVEPMIRASGRAADAGLANYLKRDLRPVLVRARPVFNNLATAAGRPGPDNDTSDLLSRLIPLHPKAEPAVDAVVRALDANQEEAAEARAYSPDIFSAFAKIGSLTSPYDAQGPYAKVTPTSTGVFQLNGSAIQPADTTQYGGLEVVTGLQRCPGGGATPIAGSNPFLDNGNLTGKCDPSQVP